MILADYGNILTDITSDWPPLAKSSLPEICFYSHVSDESPTLPISDRISRLILVLSAISIAKPSITKTQGESAGNELEAVRMEQRTRLVAGKSNSPDDLKILTFFFLWGGGFL
ncbi:hypothetical protein Godav_019358 [Gossypium davidsonii]|uniref:Uncharacterized protein n=2 Tax=Gossypium TaxID=3633 RepID=A0A7J8R0C7_GOSDV|nr:hypothetical protein [Gossypium davidsonii]MBA0641942.1 hypothetical protein [Gossypium klotzschianum]